VTLLVVAIGLWAVFIGLILNHEYAITLLPGNPPTSAPDGIVYQSTDYSCGPACLATIFRYYNIIKSEREWAELSGTLITYGTTLPGLVRAGVSIGFEPVELHPTYEQLDLVNYPGIIFKSSAYHLVTFWGMDSDSRVIVRDPAIGCQTWGPAEFSNNTMNEPRILIFHPGPVPRCDPDSSSREIGRVQDMLRTIGFFNGNVTGRWSDSLADAIRSFQRDMNVEVTGTVDPPTGIYLEGAWRLVSRGASPPLMQMDRSGETTERSIPILSHLLPD